MIYLAVIILAFCIFIIYKEKGAARFFLLSLALGWFISLFGLIIYLLYLRERDLYTHALWKILYVKDFFPEFNISYGINMEFTVIAMNFGVLLFIYSCICFTISFARPLKSNLKIYTILSIPPIIEFIIYNPWFYQKFYRFIFSRSLKDYSDFTYFYHLEGIVYRLTSLVNYIYLGLSIILIVYNYCSTPRLKYFRSYGILIYSGLFTIISSFITILWWAPKRLISVAVVSDYIHILPVPLVFEGKMLTVFSYVIVVSFIVLAVAMYIFNSTYLSLNNMKNSIIKSIDVTGIGIRFFSHMIKNYAMAVSIDAESIKSKIKSGEDCSQQLDRIVNSSNDLMQRLDEMKSKFSMVSLNLDLTDVNVPIENALEKVTLGEVELIYKHDGITPSVLLDSRHMTEVIVNIINNAVHEMIEDRKTLTIEIFQEKLWIVISISDTGRGIEPQNINKIFTPFYTTKGRNNNWGLGLSYCYRVIMAHRGKMFVESEVNKGTTFKILIPFIQEK
ncbi:MAG: ATP-binding protein [Clostridia bacterium]